MERRANCCKIIRVLLFIVVPTIFISSNVTAGTPIWSDNFESYPLDTFPSSGGWQLISNGAGTAYQYVDDAYSISGTHSLHLAGSNCWSASAYHAVNIPAQVTLEANIFLDGISCGCDPIVADIGLGAWGTHYGGAVYFHCDGKIYAGRLSTDRSKDVLLTTYAAKTWYKVRLDVDMNARTYNVYIDGVLRGSDIQIFDTEMPTGVLIGSAHGVNLNAWFDDISISSNEICECDLNHDGRCNMLDWGIFGKNWGKTSCSVQGLSVVEYGPLNGLSGVSTGGPIYVLFSENINPATLNSSTFSINGVSGTVTLNYGKWATFVPTSNLAYSTTYTVTLTTGIASLSGAHLPTNMNWVFTTGQPPIF